MNARATVHFGHKASGLKHANAAHSSWQRGVELSGRQQWREACKHFEQACKAAPGDLVYRLNLARALMKQERWREAVAQCRLILQADGTQVLARRMAGESLLQMGEHVESVAVLQDGLDAGSQDFDYLSSLGQAMLGAGRNQEAISVFMQAIALKVDHAPSFYHLAMCFHNLKMRKEAAECLETAQVLKVEKGEMACDSMLAFIRRECVDWTRAEQDLQSLRERVMAASENEAQWLSVFGSVVLTDDPLFQRKAAEICARYAAGLAEPSRHQGKLGVGRKLKLGMVSADFHHHATTILMAELIEQLDRNRFEVSLYSHGPDDRSPMRERIQRAADRFVEVGAMSARQAAECIEADGVDVLIDLKGHTANGRVGIFAWRPAPIQVTYLGFPGTTGASYMDYFIGDAVASPIEHADDFTEKLALMPHCYQPNDRLRARPVPTTRAAHGLPDDAVVLCGFNQPFKISPEVMDVWCSLLMDIPGSVLWLLKWIPECAEPLRQEFARRGIAPERLVLADPLKSDQHINRFALADIFVDAWPCNGHTTVSDALWAGVPVVTLQGRTFVSRVASSLLRAVGLEEGVTQDVDGYRAQVLRLAGDAGLRQAWRERLVSARDTAPLFDSAAYAHDFARLIERMVDRHNQGLAPDHLA